jgi:FkbM family methyltransferase
MTWVDAISDYRATYLNWFSILFNDKLLQRPMINAKLRNGKSLLVPRELLFFIKELSKINKSQEVLDFDIHSEVFTFPYSNNIVKMKFYESGKFNGEFTSFLGDYNFLEPVAGNTIIDIGANIADSSLWFALRGAILIIGLEPYRWSYNMAIKNVELNNFDGKIILCKAGYGPSGEIEIEDSVSNIGTELKEFKGGFKTKLFSLYDILENYKTLIGGDILLKMDCEGCEYNLLNEEADTLRRFKRIIIEYHYGYEKLITKLKEANFIIKFTKPRVWYSNNAGKKLTQGYIFAEQNDLRLPK